MPAAVRGASVPAASQFIAEAEAAVNARTQAAMADLGIVVEAKNQARWPHLTVHETAHA